jgi:predicted metalloendopeptidase
MFAPFLDENADYATNLGTLGATLGHEISHAFDSSGVLYDAYGNYNPDIMPEVDVEAFKERQQKVIDYYDGFTVLGSHVNGKKTLAENLADISGLQCALAIAAEPEEQKKVFEGYARSWECLIIDKYAKDQLDTDEHAPDMIRVNAVVACFDEFYEIYDVKEDDAMYVAPEERIRRW